MPKDLSQQSLTPPTLNNPVAGHQDAFGYKAHAKGHFVTHGEKKFDRFTYTTVGYIINALLSVVAVHWVERTPSGQKAMGNFVDWAKKTFPKSNPKTVEMLATKSFFLSGGFAVLAPMKWLEDKKLQMVKKWDRKYYGEAADTDPTLIQSHRDIAAAPKQTWGSIFASRILALVPFYITVGALWDRKSLLSRYTNKDLGNVHREATEAYFAKNPEVSQSWFSRAFNSDLKHARSEAMDHFIHANPEAASKGIYFDRPISWASRKIGKLFANGEAKAKLTAMEQSHPGHIATKTVADGSHDNVHASTPYYFISEAITSGMVAWGVYVLTRVLGPIMGNKKKAAVQVAKEEKRIASPVQKDEAPDAEPQLKKEDQTHDLPHTKVQQVMHEARQEQAVAQPSL